jgi:hypothetical protein
MRLSRTSIQNAVAGVAVAALATSASAGLVYDLRWADQPSDDSKVAGPTQVLDLWVQVSGTNGIQTDEGLTNSYVVIMSTQLGGGAILDGGMASGALALGFNEAGSRPGAPNELNGDGIVDWGATVTAVANTNYMLARNATVGGAVTGGTLGQSVDANTWEFKIASFQVNASAFGGGSTTFNVVQPSLKNTVGTTTYAAAKVDGATFAVTNANTQQAFANSSGATLVPIPEPASVGLLGAAAVGLLGRRRKQQ